MFTAPYNRAGFFAELWMLQYVSNVEDWVFGELTFEELEFLFATHAQVCFCLESSLVALHNTQQRINVTQLAAANHVFFHSRSSDSTKNQVFGVNQ